MKIFVVLGGTFSKYYYTLDSEHCQTQLTYLLVGYHVSHAPWSWTKFFVIVLLANCPPLFASDRGMTWSQHETKIHFTKYCLFQPSKQPNTKISKLATMKKILKLYEDLTKQSAKADCKTQKYSQKQHMITNAISKTSVVYNTNTSRIVLFLINHQGFLFTSWFSYWSNTPCCLTVPKIPAVKPTRRRKKVVWSNV